jgi:hypothetical protein
MDHAEAVRQKATEKYLLNELDPEQRDQFEEHLFDCQDCALDVRTASVFLEQAKVQLAESAAPYPERAAAETPAKPGWLAWLRPAFAVPALALLLAVILYQNFVTYPHLMQAANEPQVGPWASVNVSTRGESSTAFKLRSGEGFGLLVNIPPDTSIQSYKAELYNPAGVREWSGAIASGSGNETRQIYIPGRGLQSGTYVLVVNGITSAGESKELGRHPIELQIQN